MSVMEQEPARALRAFTEEFKRDAVALVIDEDRKVIDVARCLGVGEGTLGNRMSRWWATSPTSRPVKDGCTSRRCSISVRVACWVTRWRHTCVPSSSPTRSRWPPPLVVVGPSGSSSTATAAANTWNNNTRRSLARSTLSVSPEHHHRPDSATLELERRKETSPPLSSLDVPLTV